MSAPQSQDAASSKLLHPEVLGDHFEGAHDADGRPLVHAEATSRPIREPVQQEPQPRGAKDRGHRPVDPVEAAGRFVTATIHEKAHDERLWDGRLRRDAAAHALPEWEAMRAIASATKEHTLAHLGQYLAQFEAAAEANGVIVHWAEDAAEHNRIVHDILRTHGAKTLIKSKSMLTDECGFRAYMKGVGIEVIETDLGERIQQLDNEEPSHITGPAIHKTRADVAKVFASTLGSDPTADDIHKLATVQRDTTRPYILAAGAGMTGCNFAVAETGTVVVCTNEGNADLSANTPPLHIVSMGIEKLVPTLAHLTVFVRLLARNAIGTPLTQYTSHFRAPRPGTQMHYVIVDNGRSARLGLAEFWTSLKCIRCAACMNTCPVYRRSGGLSYGATYSGPIGVILSPTFDRAKYSALPFVSTLNGSCTNVCPVKINIHEQIFAWRRVMAEEHRIPLAKAELMRTMGYVLAHPTLYRTAIAAADEVLRWLPHFVIENRFNTWSSKGRDTPNAPKQTFHSWWYQNRIKGGKSA